MMVVCRTNVYTHNKRMNGQELSTVDKGLINRQDKAATLSGGANVVETNAGVLFPQFGATVITVTNTQMWFSLIGR